MKRLAHPNAKLLTLKQAEAEYGLPYATLWSLVTERRLPRLELPNQRSIYIRRVDLEAFIDGHMTEVAS
jgi:predicted DNA-binding transcriptional regulator AlpA